MDNQYKGEEAYSQLKDHVKACDEKHRDVINKIMNLQTEMTKVKERQNNFGHQLNDIKVSIDELGSKQDTLTRRLMLIAFGIAALASGSPHFPEIISLFTMGM